MQEIKVPPLAIAVVIVAVIVIGFVAYQAAQPPIPTSQRNAAGTVPDPKNPARPPVADAHANDWRPPSGR